MTWLRRNGALLVPSPDRRGGSAIAALPAIVAAAVTLALPAQDAPRLRSITVHNQDIFSDTEAGTNPFFWLANLLHATTDEAVIRRELWFQPGDRVTQAEVEEAARNLRALRLFGAATTELVRHDDDSADLVVQTRDRFTLSLSASVASVGGVEKYNFRIAENNLFGTGKGFAAVVSQEDNETTRQLRFSDPQFLGTWHTLFVRVGDTEQGNFGEFALARPFRRLEDPYSYGVEMAAAEEELDYFQRGEEVAQVPQHRADLRLYGATQHGPRELRDTWGLDLRLRQRDYSPATGIGATSIDVPGDTDEIEFGPYWARDWRPEFRIGRRIDSLDFDEDLPLGAHLGLRLAGRWRQEAGHGGELQPVLAVELRGALSPAEHTYLTLDVDAEARLADGALAGYGGYAALHGYWQGLPAQTLCGSVRFDAIAEFQGLQPQLTLGEDNGLRGYPAREFAGSRMVRCNFEDRIDTGLEFLSLRLGVVAFADIGFLHDPVLGQSLSDPIRSVGCGLRLGSSHLFGNRVLRLDVAWPLDDPIGDSYSMSVSVAVGQVFTFFGNASSLSTEF